MSKLLSNIATGVGIGGDLLNIGSSLFGDSGKKEARRQFNASFYTPIQTRVKDAQAAGIHPLFALGASVGASPTSFIGGQARTGSQAGDALASAGRRLGSVATGKRSKILEDLGIKAAEQRVKTDAALEAKYNSEAAVAMSNLSNDQMPGFLEELRLDDFRRTSDRLKRRFEPPPPVDNRRKAGMRSHASPVRRSTRSGMPSPYSMG